MLGQVGAMLELCWPMLAHLGAMLGYVGQLGPFPPFREASWSELGRQVGPKLAQVGSKFGQVGAKMRHVGAKLAQVGAKVAQVGTKMDPRWLSKRFFYRFQGMSKFVSIFQPIWNRFFMIF